MRLYFCFEAEDQKRAQLWLKSKRIILRHFGGVMMIMAALLPAFLMKPAWADLKISANTEVWALPAETKSCVAWKSGKEQNDIKSKYINLGNLGFEWSDPQRSLNITEIRVSLRSPILKNQAYECHIVGQELEALGEGKWMSIQKSSVEKSSLVDTDCALVCGGIEFDKDIEATISGKIEVLGEVTSASKTESVIYGLPITADNVEF